MAGPLVQFRILGPLDVLDPAGRRIEIAGRKPRALLAILLLHANEVVPVTRLIDGLWGEELPEGAGKALQIYVSRLRKSLGGAAALLETRGGGYAVNTERAELDLARFVELEREARRALADGDAAEAAGRLAEALALWRGPPLAEFAGEAFGHEVARLEERRLAAIEERIDAELALGRHAALVAELGELVEEHPFRERLRAQLMLALARSGRQADALRVYDEGWRKLVDDLGIEPGAALRELQGAILRQEASVVQGPASPAPARAPEPAVEPGEPEAEPDPRAPRRRRVRLAAAMAAVVVLGAAAVAVVVRGAGGDAGRANVVAAIDPSRAAVDKEIDVGERPNAVAFGAGAAWVASLRDRTISRIDPETRAVRPFGLGFVPGAIAVGENSVWVADAREGRLYRFNAVTFEPEADLPIGEGGPGPVSVAVGEGAVWVANSNAFVVVRIDPRAERIVEEIGLASPRQVVAGSEGVWVAEASTAVVEIDPVTNEVVNRLTTGFVPGGLALGDDSVWVSYPADDTVWRFHAPTRSFRRTIPVGAGPGALAFGSGALWIANALDRSVSRLDPETNELVASVVLGGRPAGLAVGGGSVWVAVAPR